MIKTKKVLKYAPEAPAKPKTPPPPPNQSIQRPPQQNGPKTVPHVSVIIALWIGGWHPRSQSKIVNGVHKIVKKIVKRGRHAPLWILKFKLFSDQRAATSSLPSLRQKHWNDLQSNQGTGRSRLPSDRPECRADFQRRKWQQRAAANGFKRQPAATIHAKLDERRAGSDVAADCHPAASRSISKWVFPKIDFSCLILNFLIR